MIDISILLAIAAFGLIVLLHEMGHFVAAKASGVKVNEFAVGFGPAIFKKQIGETVYALRVIPFGGATVMEGEDEENFSPGSFQSAPLGKRAIILFAGSFMNLLMGLIILLILFAPVNTYLEPVVDDLMDGFEFRGESGFMPGDRITKVNGRRILLQEDLIQELSTGEGKPFDFVLIRDGKKVVLNDLPLEKREYTENGSTNLYYGFRFAAKEAKFADKVKLAAFTGIDFARMVADGLKMLISGSVGVKDMSGPVGITTVISDAAEESPMSAWYFIAFIAINIGIMNLLPFPALDGGRLVFVAAELIRGKPINPKYEGYIHAAGLLLLFALLIFVTFNDIMKLVGG